MVVGSAAFPAVLSLLQRRSMAEAPMGDSLKEKVDVQNFLLKSLQYLKEPLSVKYNNIILDLLLYTTVY